MSLIKKFGDFFSNKPDFDEIDIKDLTDLFEEFLDELFINHDLERSDLEFSLSIKSPKVIKAEVIINPNINIRGRQGSMIVKEVLRKIIESEEMKTLRSQIKQNYKLYDTLDELEKLENESRFDRTTTSDFKILNIQDSGFITFTITPK
jgi:hypothetical protein